VSGAERRGQRVILVAPQPFFHAAGTPLNIRAICRALTEGGYRVHLLTLPLGSNVPMDGLTYHRTLSLPLVRRVPVGFSLAKAAYNLVLLFHLVFLLIRLRPVAVHAFEEAAFYACPIARLFGIASVMDLDSDMAAQLRGLDSTLARVLAKFVAPVQRFALRRSSCALTVAAHLSDLVRHLSPDTFVAEIRDIPPDETLRAPDAAAMARLRQSHALGTGPLVLYTGNFDIRQGVEALIRAVPPVVAQRPDARLVLVGGEVHETAKLKSLASSLGVADSVYFAGRQPSETMPEWMGLAAVLASPRLEPLVTPLKIYAYMASGRPIVATDLPTHTQVLDERSAVLVSPDPAGLASGIVRVLGDPEGAAALGTRAREIARDRHSYAAFKEKILDAYRQSMRSAHA
jgi:glycosyltransferase involved in cell wall biosynthesis